MLREIDLFFLQKHEPLKGYLLFLRNYILAFDDHISESWKYKMPFYCYNGKMFCYLWVNKKTSWPYIGFVDGNKMEHLSLLTEKRARMKILVLNPLEDVPLEIVRELLSAALPLIKKRLG